MLRTFYRLDSEGRDFDHFRDVFAAGTTSFAVDRIALVQFVLFGHPLYERTFLRDVSFRYSRLDGSAFQLEFDESRNGYDRGNEETLWMLLNQAVRLYCRNPNLRCGIGNSGGLDSRFIVYIASQQRVDAHLFTVGDAPSDAVHIANRLARQLGYANHHYSVEANYLARYARTLVAERPMSPFEACFWLSVRDRLPAFDLVLTGFNGGLIRGAHLEAALRTALSRDELYRLIYTSGKLRAVPDGDLAPLLNDPRLLHDAYDDFRAHIGRSHHRRPENIWDEFEFLSRQLIYIRRSPQFDYLDRFVWKSPYYDEAVVRFACGLTFEERLNERLFRNTARRFMKELRHLRFERSPLNLMDEDRPRVRALKNYLWKLDRRHDLKLYFRGTHKAFNRQCVNRENHEFIQAMFAVPNDAFSAVFNYPRLIAELDHLIASKYVLVLNLLAIKLWMDRVRRHLH